MTAVALGIPDVLLLTPRVYTDHRGLFFEAWNATAGDGVAAGVPTRWVQDNVSESVRGVLRGLHCQVQHPQGKLVRCVAGAVFDVAVDVRATSPTFGQWCGALLDTATHAALWIPAGFAHGFYVLSERATVIYKVTDAYAPAHERCLRWDDPSVGIAWPLVDGAPPILAAKDAGGDSLEAARHWFPGDF